MHCAAPVSTPSWGRIGGKVGRTLGHEAKLERAAHTDEFGVGQLLEHGGDFWAGVVAAGHDAKFVLVDFADVPIFSGSE